MTFILLDVPHVGQRDIGAHAGHESRAELNGCWYAATCMVSYFWEIGPRLGVPKQYEGGHNPKPMSRRYSTLKANENYEGALLPATRTWSAFPLYWILMKHGPCYVRRGFRDKFGKLTGGHAVVLTGCNISSSEVCVLDPWYSQDNRGAGPDRWRQHHSIDAFNDFFKWEEPTPGTSLMYKKQANPGEARQHIKSRQESRWW
jgi:hypothetical protein